MLADPTGRAAAFAAVFAALYVAPGWAGRIACAAHVTTYTLTALVALVVLAAGTALALDPGRVAVGLLISAVSHYIADRRTPLRKLAGLVGAQRFYALGAPRPGRDDNPSLGTGAYALDQSFHLFFLFTAALFIA